MNDKNYSLCAAYPLRNNPDKLMFFRLADYNNYSKEFMPILCEGWGSEAEPKIIGAKPMEVRENLTEVREWKYNDDNRGHTMSFRKDISFYELVFLKELSGVSYNNKNKIREILLSGFWVDANTSSDLLIVIGETSSRYSVIHCTKSKLKSLGAGLYSFSDNVSDMLHVIHYLCEYDILKKDIIDTEDLRLTTVDGTTAPTRYFYRYSELPESNGKFRLFEVDTYIPQYISRYLRKNKEIAELGNTDIRKIADLIQMILENREYLAEYFATTGYTQEQLEGQLSNYSSAILSGLLSDQEIDETIRTTLFNSEKIRSACLEVARSEWFNMKSEEKEQLLKEIVELSDEKEKIEHENSEALSYVTLLEEERTQLDAEIAEKTDELNKIRADIQNELKEFSENIVHSVALSTVVRTYSSPDTNKKNAIERSLIFNQSFDVVEVNEELADKADFEEALSDNIEGIGYKTEDAVDISQLISFCISNKCPLLVCNSGEKLANAVSATLGVSNTHIINVPSGFSDLDGLRSDLKDTITGSPVTVFYVTGVFDGYNTGVYNTLHFIAKESANIVLFIVALDGIDISILPRTIWESAMFLDDNLVIQYAEESSPTMHYGEACVFDISYGKKEMKEKMKELSPYADLIDKRACIQLAKFLVEMGESINNSAIGLQQLLVFAQAKGNADSVCEKLRNAPIPDKSKRLIKNYLKGEDKCTSS